MFTDALLLTTRTSSLSFTQTATVTSPSALSGTVRQLATPAFSPCGSAGGASRRTTTGSVGHHNEPASNQPGVCNSPNGVYMMSPPASVSGGRGWGTDQSQRSVDRYNNSTSGNSGSINGCVSSPPPGTLRVQTNQLFSPAEWCMRALQQSMSGGVKVPAQKVLQLSTGLDPALRHSKEMKGAAPQQGLFAPA